MKIMKFDEYLNSKCKIEEKPFISVNADRVDPETIPNSPPGGGNPYISKGIKNKKGTSKALGDMGEDITDMPKELYGKGKSAAKIPTVDEVTLILNITKAAQKNPTIIESVVLSLKNQGLLGSFVAETLNHRETYKHLSKIMAHESYGPELCGKLIRAMNEEVATPFGDELDDDEEVDNDDGEDGVDDDGEDGVDDDGEEAVDDDGVEAVDDDGEEAVDDDGEEGVDGDGEEGVDGDMGDPRDMERIGDDENQDNPTISNFRKSMKNYMRRMRGE